MLELLRRFKTRPGLSAELVAASLFANMLALATPLFVIQVLNRYIAHGVDATLATLTIGAVIAVILEYGFRQVRLRLARGLSTGSDKQAAIAGFAVLVQAKAVAVERIPPGQRREIVAGATAIETAYGANNICTVLDLPFSFLFVFVLYLLHPILAGIAFLFIAVVFAAGTLNAAMLRGKMQDMVTATNTGGALIGTAVSELDTVRAFNAAGFLRQAWETQTSWIQGLRQRIAAKQGWVQTFTQSATAMMSISVVAVGAILVVSGEMDVGAMIGANILAARALQPISRFAALGEALVKARQSLELLREFAKLPLEAETGSAKSEYQGGLEMRDVAFAFPGGSAPLFETLSLTLPPGSVLVVAGSNGTGKTTLARLMVGLLEPSRGQILADGLDLRQVAPEWWRRQVIYLPQEPAFFNATIEENLRMINPDIDGQDLNRVIDAAGLRRFLDESEGGFETQITNNGRNLALGIRRRLALSRALASDGMLAVLDEPTEGLDVDGVAAVGAAIRDLVGRGRTIIVFSHDKNFLKGAQAVIDLNVKPVPRVSTAPRKAKPEAGAPQQEGAVE